MALSYVASSAWVAGTGSVTPTVPSGAAVGDLILIHLGSKYDTATLASDPAGWTSLGVAFNTGLTAGNDAGNLRIRSFYRIRQTGDTMPALSPVNNNVTLVSASAYRSTTKLYDLQAHLEADNQAGGLGIDAGPAAMDIKGGDFIHYVAYINGDGPTPLTTLAVSYGAGSTISSSRSSAPGLATALGTDMEVNSWYDSIVSGVGSSISTTWGMNNTQLNGTAGATSIIRIREATASAAPAFSGWGIPI